MLAFAVLGIANFVVYAKLSKYLWMSAGVKKSDVRRFNSEHHVQTQRQMSAWLLRNAKHPKECAKMFIICNVVVFLFFVSFSLIFFAWRLNNIEFAKIAVIAVAAISAVVWGVGFSYGKRIEADFGDYFSTSEYTPYMGESSDSDEYSESEYYEDEQEEQSLTDEQRSFFKKARIVRYFIRLIVVAIIVLMALSPIIFKNHTLKINTGSTGENSQQTQSDDSYVSDNSGEDDYILHKDKSAVTYDELKNLFANSGYEFKDYSKQAETDHPGFNFSECYGFEDDYMHFEYLSLDSNDSASDLQKKLQTDIEDKYKKGADSENEQKDSKKDFRLYTLETSEVYAVSVYAQNIVIYAYCDPINATWLKSNLYNIGYLEDF